MTRHLFCFFSFVSTFSLLPFLTGRGLEGRVRGRPVRWSLLSNKYSMAMLPLLQEKYLLFYYTAVNWRRSCLRTNQNVPRGSISCQSGYMEQSQPHTEGSLSASTYHRAPLSWCCINASFIRLITYMTGTRNLCWLVLTFSTMQQDKIV